jgi:hypothetical protein
MENPSKILERRGLRTWRSLKKSENGIYYILILGINN